MAVTRDAAATGEGVGGTPAASAGGAAEGGLGSVGGAAGGGVAESGVGGAVKGGAAEAAASAGGAAEVSLGSVGGAAGGGVAGVDGVTEAAVSAGEAVEGSLGSVGGAAGGGVAEAGVAEAGVGGTAEAATSVGQVAEGGLGGSGGAADGEGADRVRGGGAGKGGAGGGALAVSRRLFVARTVAAAATTVAAGTVGYGAYTVLRGPRLKRITVPLAKLPRRAHGFRIAVVSDMHLGPILGRSHTQRVVETINRTHPDLIAVVGDLVDGSVADLGPAVEPLRRLSARYGSYFVTGNHEYYSGAAEWVDHVRELGLRPLENERTELPGFDLAGVNDVAGESEGHGPDFDKALGDRDPARASVLLAHQPVVIHDAVKAGVDLQLSGHTHGGQLWPGTYLAELANPTAAGLDRYGDTQLYVSRGAGAWGPPVRVGAPPDVTVVELASPRA
ncbi:metallophosphoesterase [Streptomyces luomodiensis]|uniref:Metallophosphoesterase n=1 Tax=Streptomyces luomodiensis TaxID=3026192 RepID=A0ABY9V9K1_9ACTN|nr:metallophosphoesterase [Streptomyces sp. SCA4-21]WNF01601.1 metallophosphoesterase [Streptomyces sp. SCA4-21]